MNGTVTGDAEGISIHLSCIDSTTMEAQSAAYRSGIAVDGNQQTPSRVNK